jgi:hypothetical protein
MTDTSPVATEITRLIAAGSKTASSSPRSRGGFQI